MLRLRLSCLSALQRLEACTDSRGLKEGCELEDFKQRMIALYMYYWVGVRDPLVPNSVLFGRAFAVPEAGVSEMALPGQVVLVR